LINSCYLIHSKKATVRFSYSSTFTWVNGQFMIDYEGGHKLDGYPHQWQPIMLTEFGGIAYTKPEEFTHTWGYARSHDSLEFQSQYTSLLQTVNKVEMFRGFCCTQLTDTIQQANGLLYADRTPKFPLEAIASATLGRRSTEEDPTMLLELAKVTWAQMEDVFSDALKARRSQSYPIQPTTHCGGDNRA
jgi:hypothetical protein